MLSSFPPFSGHPQLGRTFQHPAAALGGCSRDKVCAQLLLTGAPVGSSARSLAADTCDDAWLLFRRQPATPTQQLCKHSQPCRCLSSSTQRATEGLRVQKPFAVFSRSRPGCLHCQPCINRLATALSAGGNRADSSGGECDLSGLESSDLTHHCKYQSSLLVK